MTNRWEALQDWADDPARTTEEILAVAKAEARTLGRVYVLAKLYRAWHKRVKPQAVEDLSFLSTWALSYDGDPDPRFSSPSKGKVLDG